MKAEPPSQGSSRTLPSLALSAVLIGLAACGIGAPEMHEYILGTGANSTTGSIVETGLPIIRIKSVEVPDYLDTKDIVTRDGGEVTPSRTGRWAERLSVGMTRALVLSLSAKLKGAVVTADEPTKPPARSVLVQVIAFEPTSGGKVVLEVRWSVTSGSGKALLTAERIAVTEQLENKSDGAVVEAMSRAVEELADRIASGIEHTLPSS